MIFLDHRKEFLIKAAMYAKHTRMKELNNIESDLMQIDHLIMKLKTRNYPEHLLLGYGTEIETIRKIIKEKKLRLL